MSRCSAATVKVVRPGLTLMELLVVLVILVALASLLIPLLSSTQTTTQVTTTQASMNALRTAVLAYYQDMKGLQTGMPATPTSSDLQLQTGVPRTLTDLQIQPLYSNGTAVQSFVPFTQRGWRGPYMLQSTGVLPLLTAAPALTLNGSLYPTSPTANPYGNPGDPAFLDGWGNPIVLQWPQTSDPVATRAQYVRLLSAGPPSILVSGQMVSQIAPTSATAENTPPGYAGPIPVPSQPTPGNPTLANQRLNNLMLFILTQDPYP